MKKLMMAAVLAMCAFAALAQEAQTWTSNLALGFSLPISTLKVDEDGADDISQVGYGIGLSYIGYHKRGFTAKANASLGLVTTRDIEIQERNTNFGVFSNLALGAGYSFVRTDRVLLGTTAMLGVEVAYYSYDDDEKISGIKHDYKNELSIATISAGADIFGSFRFRQGFSLFANVEVRYPLIGNAKIDRTDKYEKDRVTYTGKATIDNDVRGRLLVQPTFGVMFTF